MARRYESVFENATQIYKDYRYFYGLIAVGGTLYYLDENRKNRQRQKPKTQAMRKS